MVLLTLGLEGDNESQDRRDSCSTFVHLHLVWIIRGAGHGEGVPQEVGVQVCGWVEVKGQVVAVGSCTMNDSKYNCLIKANLSVKTQATISITQNGGHAMFNVLTLYPFPKVLVKGHYIEKL